MTLLRSQSERCREILKRLTSLSSEGEAHLSRLPLTSLVEEVTAPHRDFGISIMLRPGERVGPEPVGRRNPGVIYGLGNLVENAVDFARESVTVRWSWDEAAVTFSIIDDGPGFPPEIIDRIGEPYMSTRQGGEAGGGLGLGLFIAKTLLERSGATARFPQFGRIGRGRHRAGYRGHAVCSSIPTRRRPACSTRLESRLKALKVGHWRSGTISA